MRTNQSKKAKRLFFATCVFFGVFFGVAFSCLFENLPTNRESIQFVFIVLAIGLFFGARSLLVLKKES